MSNSLPIKIQLGSLPAQVSWTPQQLGQALVARMSLVTNVAFALFVTGATAPLSDVGPWFNTTTGTWWIWSSTAGAYVPMASNPTPLYPARAIPLVTQTVAVDTAKHLVNFATEVFDPENIFASSRYVAAVDGYYDVGCGLRVNNSTGVAASMALTLEIWKNGAGIVATSGATVPSPTGSAWFPNIGYNLVQMAQGDYIEAYLTAEDGTNSGNVAVQVNSFFNAALKQEIV